MFGVVEQNDESMIKLLIVWQIEYINVVEKTVITGTRQMIQYRSNPPFDDRI